MKRFTSILFASSKTHSVRTARRATLNLEALQDRLCPAVTMVNGSTGTLVITSDSASDKVVVSSNTQPSTDGTLSPTNSVKVEASTNVAGAWANTWSSTFDGVNKIEFHGGSGSDMLVNNKGIRVEAYGEAGNDTMTGGAAGDYLNGGIGNDVLNGNSGDDHLFGGDGDDTLSGGNGQDFLTGGIGDDVLRGNDGLDSLYGEAGNDTLSGGDDNYMDELSGGSGADKFVINSNYWIFFANQHVQDFDASEGDLKI